MEQNITSKIEHGVTAALRVGRIRGLPRAEVTRNVGHSFTNIDCLEIVPPKDGLSTNFINQGAAVHFDMPHKPSRELKDDKSAYLRFTLVETGGAYGVCPTFVEGWLEKNAGVQWRSSQADVGKPIPSIRTLLEPILASEAVDYERLCHMLNHSEKLDPTVSSTYSILAGATRVFHVRLPNPFPRNQPYWLGANKGRLSVTIQSPTAGIVAGPIPNTGGTGVLQCTKLELILECNMVGPEYQMALAKKYVPSYVWTVPEVHLNESQTPMVLATAGPASLEQRLDALAGLQVSSMMHFIRVNNQSITNNNMFRFLDLPDSASFAVKDSGGQILFAPTATNVGFNQYGTLTRQYGGTQAPESLNVLVTQIAPDQNLIKHSVEGADDHGKYHLSGLETVALYDAGSALNGTSVRLDTVAWVNRYYHTTLEGDLELIA